MTTAAVRVAVLSASRRLGIESIKPAAVPDSGGWIAVDACGVCGSDWSWYAERDIPAPFIPGHEIVGTVTDLWGRQAQGLQIGDRIVLEEALPCGHCSACLSGRHRLCATSGRYGGTSLETAPSLWGGLAERVYLSPAARVHHVPPTVDSVLATLFVPLANGLSWIAAAGSLRPDDTVAVLGVGQHGLACVAAARRCGAGTVIAVGRSGDRARLAAAERLGADVLVDVDADDLVQVLDECTHGAGVDLTVDTTPGATDVLDKAVAAAAIGGRIVVAGLKSGRESPLRTDLLVRRELIVRGVAARESWAIDGALSWLARDHDSIEAIESRVFGLEEAAQAIEAIGGALGGERLVHAVVTPNAT